MIFDLIKTWKKNIIILKVIINEIIIKIRYKYIKYKYYILIWKLMINYFIKYYKDKDIRKSIEIRFQI